MQLVEAKSRFRSFHCDIGVSEEPSSSYFFRCAQVSAGTGHREVSHAIQIEAENLMNVPRNDIFHPIFPRQPVERKAVVPEH